MFALPPPFPSHNPTTPDIYLLEQMMAFSDAPKDTPSVIIHAETSFIYLYFFKVQGENFTEIPCICGLRATVFVQYFLDIEQ